MLKINGMSPIFIGGHPPSCGIIYQRPKYAGRENSMHIKKAIFIPIYSSFILIALITSCSSAPSGSIEQPTPTIFKSSNQVTSGQTTPSHKSSAQNDIHSAALNTALPNLGIRVFGVGQLILSPDIAILDIGIEAVAPTVHGARQDAASAAKSLMKVLQKHDISDNDIQTSFFNIYPRYEYVETSKNGNRIGKQVLIGFEVNNVVKVKVRDIAKSALIIDNVIDAVGEYVRLNGIAFTIDNKKLYEAELRNLSITDAIIKADHFASLLGMSRGNAISINDYTGSSNAARPDLTRMGIMNAEMGNPSSINPGEIQLDMTVEVIFSLEPE